MSFNVSSFVDEIVPPHISQDYPDLIEFIKVYALFLEKEHSAGYYLNHIDHQRDIDLIETELLEELQREIGVSIPRKFETDPRLFYKHLVEFYRSRGTPASITAFFKLIHRDEVEVYYPLTDILAPSPEGNWRDDTVQIQADLAAGTPVPTSHVWTLTRTNLASTFDRNKLLNAISVEFSHINNSSNPSEDSELLAFLQETVSGNDRSDLDEDGDTDFNDHLVVLREIAGDQQDIPPSTAQVNLEAIITDAKAAYIADGSFSSYVATSLPVIDFADDDGNDIKLNSDLIYVNDVHAPDAVERLVYNTATSQNEWQLSFTDTVLEADDVVKAYRRGEFQNLDGFADQQKKLQDSYFYQKFSYVMRTGVNNKEWKANFNKLIHPAGFIFFGEIYIFTEILDKGIPVIQPGSQVGGLPVLVFIDLVDFGINSSSISESVVKDLKFESTILNHWGTADHFEDRKFQNPRPMKDYRQYTFEDVINKVIGIQIGSQIEIS